MGQFNMAIESDPRILNDRFEAARKEYERAIATFARNTVNQLPSWGVDDIKQELLLLLWKCCQKYDPDRGASFKTLFQGSARNLCISLVRESDAQKRGKALMTTLDETAFARAAENMRTEGSAEDWFFAMEDLGPRLVAEYGVAARTHVAA